MPLTFLSGSDGARAMPQTGGGIILDWMEGEGEGEKTLITTDRKEWREGGVNCGEGGEGGNTFVLAKVERRDSLCNYFSHILSFLFFLQGQVQKRRQVPARQAGPDRAGAAGRPEEGRQRHAPHLAR